MKKNEVILEKEDILKNIYFIAEMTQNSGEKGMYGTLAGKSDLMGGIFDRWINVVPESVIFNKLILPQINQGKKVSIITDFYKYNPKQETTGIAPDVLGLRVNDKVIPFIVYDEKWLPIDKMPQIEVKTFKKPQLLVSLRDQGYAGKYLVMVESNYRVDYLLPFFDQNYFSTETYNHMIMDDKIFIKSNKNNLISHLKQVDTSDKSLGSLKLLKITETQIFEDYSICCGPGITPLSIKNIEKVYKVSSPTESIKLSEYCSKQKSGLYRFNDKWYENYLSKKLIVDFYCDDISALQIIKKNKSSIYLKAIKNCTFNNKSLNKNQMYKIEFGEGFDRSSSKNSEYFFQKDLMGFIPSLENELLNTLAKIISKE